MLNKLRASGGKGFDLVMPSVTYTPAWIAQNLLQPLDESKIKVSGVIPSMWKSSAELGAVAGGERYTTPLDRGTEAICLDTRVVEPVYGEISYGTLWQPDYRGKATVRAHSALLGIGLYFDSIGKLPSNRMRDTYKDEKRMREVYEQCLAFAIERKKNIVQFRSNAQETEAAFL